MKEEDFINILGIVCCALSIIGGLVIMLSYYKLPELKTFGNKMIMYVGMSNAIYALQTLLEFSFNLNQLYDDEGFGVLCMIQGFISTYTSECMLVWISILSITIHDTVKNRIVNMAKRERIFIFLGFIIPLILSSIPFFSHSYGRNKEQEVCWITSDFSKTAQNIQIWALFYGQLWFCIFLNFGLILSTMQMLKKLDIANTETYIVIRRFLYYPFLWIICWISGTVNRSIITAGGNDVQVLKYITIVLTGSQGFLTMIIFLSDKRILEAIKNRMNLSSTQISNNDQINIHGDAENPQDDSYYNQKLLDDDQDDYFNYYNENNKINRVNQDSNNSTTNNNSNEFNCSGNSSTEQNQCQKEYANPQNSNLQEINSSERINDDNKQQQYTQQNSNYNNQKNNYRKKRQTKRSVSQKQQFQTSGEWNRMEQIDEDSDEELFDREIQLNDIKNSEQLFLSKRDTKLLYKQKKISHSSQIDQHKRQQE